MENFYDLVLEYDLATQVITKRIEIPWRNETVYNPPEYKPEKKWMPPSYPEQDYNEYLNQYTPHVRLRQERPGHEYSGAYQGILDDIKVGDLVTSHMLLVSYPVAGSMERGRDFSQDSAYANMYLLTGTPFNAFRYFTSAWVLNKAEHQHIVDAWQKKGLINEQEVAQILRVHKSIKY